MERAKTQLEWVPETPASLSVRLTVGSSSHATWLLEDGPGGTAITVGTDPSCDWKIKAASVPPHALSILLLQGAVYVRGGPDGGVLLDGHALADGWVPARLGARLDIGLARLEISAGGSEASVSDWPQSWVVHNVETPSAAQKHAPSILVDESVVQPEPARGPVAAVAATPVGAKPVDDEDAEVSGMRPSLRLSEPGAQRTSWSGRPSRSSLHDAPSLIGKARPLALKPWLYAAGCVMLVSVYAIWIALLER